MDYFPGGSVADRIESEGPIGLRAAAEIAVAVLDALSAAHRKGILHRDVKPQNILLDDHDLPHLSDFGIARVLEGSTHHTVDGTAMGTPGFMAPEQAQDAGSVDVRADVR